MSGSKAIPVMREVSGRHSRAASDAYYQSLLATNWQARGSGGVYSLFREMEEKDAHLFATLQTRKNMLAGCDWKIVAGSDSARDKDVAAVVTDTLRRIPNFHGALFQMMDALAKGFSISEVLWRVERNGGVGISAILPRNQADFAFSASGELFMLGDNRSPAASRTSQSELLPRPGESTVAVTGVLPKAMPERKFIHFAFQGGLNSPYGEPLCAKAYWYYWFKKNNLKFWAVFNEKFGSPTAIARYNAATTQEEIDRLTEVLSTLQNDAALLLPEGVALEFLEARRTGGGSTYRELADWCNDEISKIVLGQTLTTSEGRRSGSLALGNVHDMVRKDYLAADARSLGDTLTHQLVRWIVDFNFGMDVPAPAIVFEHAAAEELKSQLEIEEQLIRMGVGIPVSHFHEKYKVARPREGERVLRYDDSNLYQYHVQYGILTVNEVRSFLGLEPVSWGNVPANRGSNGGAGAGAAGSRNEEHEADAVDHADESARDRHSR